jgi:hypothetical protein
MPGQVTRFSLFSFVPLAFLLFVALNVARAQDTTLLPQAQVGKPYSISIGVDTENGRGPLTWKLAHGDLPPGLQVSAAGKIEGTPTDTKSDPYVFELSVSDASQPPQSALLRFSIGVAAAALRIKAVNIATTQLKVLGVNAVDASSNRPGAADAKSPETTPSASAGATPAVEPPAVTKLAAEQSNPTTIPANPLLKSERGQPESIPAVAPPLQSTETSKPNSESARLAAAAGSSGDVSDPPCPDNPNPPCIEGILRQWDYVVSGKMHKQSNASNVEVEVQVDGAPATLADDEVAKANRIIDKGKGRFVIWLQAALVKGQAVQVRQVVDSVARSWSASTSVADPPKGEACLPAFLDCRHTIEASAYLGLGIDTFASGETRLYLNPNAPNGPKERMVGGIDFGYRLMGRRLTRFSGQRYAWPNQLWVYGETVHGVRSTDVDCTKNSTFLTCQTALALPTRAPDQILYTFRNATSLEGFAGLRYEFLTLQPVSSAPANLYVKAQAGFLTVAGAPSAAKAIHHFGLGAIATRGQFENSYLEFGYGRNDLFAQHRLNRWKVDAYLEKRLSNGISFFTQILVDTDVGPGADSIQSYLGFNFDLWRIKDWFPTKGPGNSQ